MCRATLVGYHGRRNLGDDLFLRLGCRFLKGRGVKDVFVAGDYRHVPPMLEGLTLHAFENRAWFARVVWLQIFIYALRSRVVLFCAGSIFTIQPFFMAYVLMLFVKILRPKVRLIAIGVSIGPIRSSFDARWCGRLLGLFDEIVVRDAESANVIREISPNVLFKVANDLALTFDPVQNDFKKKKTTKIGVSLNANVVGRRNGAAVDEVIIEALSDLKTRNEGLEVGLLVVCSDDHDGDLSVADDLQIRLSQKGLRSSLVVYNGKNLDDYISGLRGFDAILTSRMHTGILAMMVGVPVMQVIYAVKISEFFMACDLGEDYLAEPLSLSVKDVSDFFEAALSGGIAELAAARRAKLMACGARTQDVLNAISF
ncbi:polysaccharide pyruvyl transferase WcaK-like protein [Fluviicoccus keumensis]|uniref:Polysaccharide pyruvyl transferase WcaK-like protein n=1 Tax=Fluviicoccus keumensis TaxID=1435465 RepID=A0A4Q7ZAD3_9GAMM|nr:polysaccharide pyruvyl transferase family protein [Fluviicoccus keumensis]RZU46843.1 polysaccharide pyruvyl transferase WcaK-like protein [Fluviicoccus keumensis]